MVSIHAPNEGSDQIGTQWVLGLEVSIHAPNEGSDTMNKHTPAPWKLFQSTLPMKGATRY